MNFFEIFKRKKKPMQSGDGFYDSSSNGLLWNGGFLQTLYQRFINPTKANITVTSESAFQLAAYWCAVRAISEDIAKLPINFFKIDSEGKKKPVLNTPLLETLRFGFNDETDSMTGIQTLVQWMLTFGNGYAEIIKNSLGDIQLILIHPTRVTISRDERGILVYTITTNTEVDQRGKQKNRTISLMENEILHLKGMGNGVVGYSVGEIFAESLGISIAAQDFTGAFFGNNLSIGAVLETDKALNKEQKEHIREDWESKFSGPSKAHKMGILDRGFKFNRLQMSSTDAELLETRKFQVEEIARIFRIPPHKLMDMTKSTFNNVEQQNINYSTDTLTPWIRRLEVQLKFKFHRTDNTVIDFDEKALLRGDSKARGQLFKELFATGSMSGNQIALAEGLPEYEGGDVRYIPLNLTPLLEGQTSAELDNEIKEKALEEPAEPQAGEQNAPESTEEPPQGEAPAPEGTNEDDPSQVAQTAVISAYLPSMSNSIDRLTKKEFYTHQDASKKTPERQLEIMQGFYCKFENELAECLKIHSTYLCNILKKEHLEDNEFLLMSKEFSSGDKEPTYQGQTNKIIEVLMSDITGIEDAPTIGEIRNGDDGQYQLTIMGWKKIS